MIRGNHLTFSVPTKADTVILGANKQRRGLLFGSPANAYLNVGFGVACTAALGFTINTNALPFIFNYRDCGDALCQDIHVFSNHTAAQTISVIEMVDISDERPYG